MGGLVIPKSSTLKTMHLALVLGALVAVVGVWNAPNDETLRAEYMMAWQQGCLYFLMAVVGGAATNVMRHVALPGARFRPAPTTAEIEADIVPPNVRGEV